MDGAISIIALGVVSSDLGVPSQLRYLTKHIWEKYGNDKNALY